MPKNYINLLKFHHCEFYIVVPFLNFIKFSLVLNKDFFSIIIPSKYY